MCRDRAGEMGGWRQIGAVGGRVSERATILFAVPKINKQKTGQALRN